MRVGIPIADLTAGLFCALGILTALIEREKSGKGQWLHTSLLQSQIFMLDFQAARWLMNGDLAPQVGNEHPTSVPTNHYLTKDGAINIAVAGEAIWRRFCEAIGRAEWIEDERFLSSVDRKRNRDRLNEMIQEIVLTRTSADWVEALTAAGVPCGPIHRIDEMFEDPQVEHLGIASPVETSSFGSTRCVGQPVALDRTPSRIACGAPIRGEHTNEILASIGITDAELTALRSRAIV